MEENVDLQRRSAAAVATFIATCTSLNVNQPPEKIVRNLCTFLCQDIDQTPAFNLMIQTEKGILSTKAILAGEAATSNGKPLKVANSQVDFPTEASKAKISRRGAELAFKELSAKFGEDLFVRVPKMWEFMAGGLIAAYTTDSAREGDKAMEKGLGQDVIDSLSVLRVTASTLHDALKPRLVDLLPKLTLALRSRYAIVRQCTARSFATICDVITTQAMKCIIEHVIPHIADSRHTTSRQGAVELIYRKSVFFTTTRQVLLSHRSDVVQELDIKALPYVIFLIVPILGRMSDADDDVRTTATNTFASLVKMVPLEVRVLTPSHNFEMLT